ncbi:hypothetical protein LCGC14_2765380, partial [marine sediment metagenome]
GNSCVGNDSSTANAQAGIYLDSDSNSNNIIGNTSLNNNNAGAGTGYGIYIGNANCDNNIVDANNISGNDVKWKDIGTNSEFEYICHSASNIQDAIDSIAAKGGTIKIVLGTTTLTGTININGGGDYTIMGEGVGSIIAIGGDWIGFDISDAKSCTLKNFKIDTSGSVIDLNREIIKVIEAADNPITIQNLTIIGDGTNGWGIYIDSDNCLVDNCTINNVETAIYFDTNSGDCIASDNRVSSCDYGMIIRGTNDVVAGNTVNSNGTSGIQIMSAYNSINGNTCNGNAIGIYAQSGNGNNSIIGNVCNSNTNEGMRVSSVENTITGNTCNDNTNIGIQVAQNYNTVSANTCSSNGRYGIYISGRDYNTISANNCSTNNTDNVSNGAGIHLVAESDYNSIIGNSCIGNTNAGAGTAYGIYI